QMGRVDPEFRYVVLKQTNGRLAVLGSYAAHATVLSGSVMEFSADYPGYWQRAVEETTRGLAVFLAGSVGSHGPVPGEGGFKGAERMGQALAKAVWERLLLFRLTNRIDFFMLCIEVILSRLHVV